MSDAHLLPRPPPRAGPTSTPKIRSPLTARPINVARANAYHPYQPNFSRLSPSTPPARSPVRSPRFPFNPDPLNASPRRGVPTPADTAAANAQATYASWPPAPASPSSPISRGVHDSYQSHQGEDYTLSRFSTTSEDGSRHNPASSSQAMLLLDVTREPSTWAATLSWILRFLVLVTSIAAAVTAGSTLSSYGPDDASADLLSDADADSSALPVWPDLNLAPTYVFMAVGLVGCCVAVAVTAYAARRRFVKPIVWLDKWMIGFGIMMTLFWAGAVAVECAFAGESGTLESLRGWSCGKSGSTVAGAGWYRHVCTEQNAAFALAIASLALEVLVLCCLGLDRVLQGQHRKESHLSEKRAGKSRA